jgi:hypothetical protein
MCHMCPRTFAYVRQVWPPLFFLFFCACHVMLLHMCVLVLLLAAYVIRLAKLNLGSSATA